MQKISTAFVGVALILMGMFALAANTIAPALGWSFSWLMPWRYWPMVILGAGTFLFLLALLAVRNPGMGALFIPAVPLNMVGAILLYASVFNQWHIWSFAWSFIIVSLAVGFLLAMIFMRNIWLGIPTIIIGANAVVLAFCSLTGLWDWWSVLWTVEPLALGLVFLLISYKTHSSAMTVLGLAACAFAAFSFTVMSGLLVFGGWFFRLSGPALLVLLGILLLGWGLVRRPAVRIAE